MDSDGNPSLTLAIGWESMRSNAVSDGIFFHKIEIDSNVSCAISAFSAALRVQHYHLEWIIQLMHLCKMMIQIEMGVWMLSLQLY